MSSGNLKFIAVMALGLASTGCAPTFVDVVQPAPRQTWVERDVEAVSSVIGDINTSEIVLSTSEKTVIGPDERVRWIAGVDLAKSKLQRSSERLTGATLASITGSSSKTISSLVEVNQFGVIGKELSVEGQLSLQQFKSNGANRYYVEFLNSGRMTETSEQEMNDAWRALSAKLKDKGLNMSNVVLGGSKYEQRSNAIVLVKVGK